MQADVSNNYTYLSTIMVLIVAGGLGFGLFANLIAKRPWQSKIKRNTLRLTMQSKLVLYTTIVLIIAGTMLIYFSDTNNTLAGLSEFEKLFHSLFWSVTSRTAGFNATDTAGLAPATMMLMIILMWIGASPGSTGGGIKTTTIGITFLALINQIRGNEKIRLFNRELAPESVKRAFLVVISSLLALGIGSTALVWVEPGKDAMDLIFETTSALGTVGLSRGITADLSVAGKYIIIFLMFIGRIGVLAFLLSFHNPGMPPKYNLPTENIIVG
jgi:Trk-type K+ transport system membrane component